MSDLIVISFDSDKPTKRRAPPRFENRVQPPKTENPPAPAPKPIEEKKKVQEESKNERRDVTCRRNCNSTC